MKDFASLYAALDASTSNSAKQAALQDYLRRAAPAECAWAVYFLAGGKPRQLVPRALLRALALSATGLPEWLFDECYETVGDLAETLALLLPAPASPQERGLATWLHEHLLPLRGMAPDEAAQRLRTQWHELPTSQRLVYFKLITGSLRVGVSRLQVTQALAAVAGLDAKLVAQRLMGSLHPAAMPSAQDYLALVAAEPDEPDEPHETTSDAADDRRADAGDVSIPHATARTHRDGRPYPFFLAHPLALPLEAFDDVLGPPGDWLVEWKWDGIRAQLVKRGGQSWLWSRGEDLVTDRFPELAEMAHALPDGTVLDGEIVVWKDERVAPFADLQKRLGRRTLPASLLRQQPVVLLAYDLLELDGRDLRRDPQHDRHAALQKVIAAAASPRLRPSPLVEGDSWQALQQQRAAARALGTEGFMLKRRDAGYGVGRTKDVGVWWKWKIDPMAIDAVLVYAQRGHGRRASVYSDYTFAVWSGPPQQPGRTLVPFAKAYSGLTDAEMARVDALVRKTTIESFGPVRSVRPTLVFELGFEGIQRSARHKSGIAVRFPRMLRWREDKPVDEADTLQTLAALLPGAG